MKVAVMGAGIMGATIGTYLFDSGVNVCLVDPFKAHVDAINASGLDIIGYDKDVTSFEKNYKIKAVTSPDQIGETVDYVCYCVKMMHLDNAIENAKCISDDHTLHISLLNGVGSSEKLLEHYPADKVAYGIVSSGGAIMAPGKVDRNFRPGFSFISVGLASKVISKELQNFKSALDKTDCTFNVYQDIDPIVWEKMIKNCTGNAICSVARLPLGRLYNDDNGAELSDLIEKEVRAVAAAQGIVIGPTHSNKGKLPPDFPHFPSTTQDILAKKQTEIDTINGAVSRIGRKYGVPTPYNDCMTMLIKLIQANYQYMKL